MSAKAFKPGPGGQNRYFPRLDMEVLLAYRPLVSPADEPRVVKSMTLGIGGLMFEDDRPLEEGSLFILDLVLGERKMEVTGKVVYVNQVSPELYQNGFSFVGLSDEEQEKLTGYFLQEYDKRAQDIP